jgi:hypothetical protein
MFLITLHILWRPFLVIKTGGRTEGNVSILFLRCRSQEIITRYVFENSLKFSWILHIDPEPQDLSILQSTIAKFIVPDCGEKSTMS